MCSGIGYLFVHFLSDLPSHIGNHLKEYFCVSPLIEAMMLENDV